MHALCEKNPKALLASARLFSESKNIFSDINIQKALIELHGALSDRKISTNERLEVDTRIAFLHAAQTRFCYGNPILSDEDAAKRLQRVVNSNVSPTMCAAANTLFAELKIVESHATANRCSGFRIASRRQPKSISCWLDSCTGRFRHGYHALSKSDKSHRR